MDDTQQPEIKFGVRDYLVRIDTKLDSKADKSEIQAMLQEVRGLDRRLRVLEEDKIKTETRLEVTNTKVGTELIKRDSKKTSIALIGSFLGVVLVTVDLFMKLHGG